jgi:hypothetical protein
MTPRRIQTAFFLPASFPAPGCPASRAPAVRTVLAVLLALVAGGCATANEDSGACTDMAVASVNVDVIDGSGSPVTDALVTWSTGGAAEEDCESVVAGSWACGWEVAGDLLITATVKGFDPQSETVTVDSDYCHVIPEFVTFTFEPEKGR